MVGVVCTGLTCLSMPSVCDVFKKDPFCGCIEMLDLNCIKSHLFLCFQNIAEKHSLLT